jgi:ornithine carbamoyltransferase
VRHLLSIGDLPDSDLSEIVVRSGQLAAQRGPRNRPLADRIIGLMFRQTSTRTRTAFSSGALRLGAQIVTFQPADLQDNTGDGKHEGRSLLARRLRALSGGRENVARESRGGAHA